MNNNASLNNDFDGTSKTYCRILCSIIVINGCMFTIEILAGIEGESLALQADALDFLTDSLTYGLSLWVIGKSIHVRSNVALAKGYHLAGMALLVFSSTLYRLFVSHNPNLMLMASLSIAALMANLISVWLLRQHQQGDANVRSVWLCSCNDAIANIIILIASAVIWLTQLTWIDLVVATFIAILFLHSAWTIVKQAQAEKRLSKSTYTRKQR